MVKSRHALDSAPAARRTSDLIGLALFFVGAACLIALAWPQHAPIPDATVTALRLLAGSGSWVVPVCLMFVGAMFLVGYERLTLSTASYGTVLLFLTYVTWQHVVLLRGAPAGNPIKDEALQGAGGYIGLVLGTILTVPNGVVWTYLALTAMTCVGVVLIVERPFIEVLRLVFHRPAVAGISVARQGVAAVRDRQSGRKQPALTGGGKGRALPAAETEETPKKRPFLSFLGDRPGSEEAAEAEQKSPESNGARQPVKITGLATRKKQGESIDQTAFPMLDVETGGDEAFKLPPITLLKESPPPPKKAQTELTEKVRIIEQTLEDFRTRGDVIEVAHGPTVTRYEIQLAPGIKVSKIVSLADNLAMALAAIDVRVEAPIPGKSAIGVEVPNANPAVVSLRECLDSPEFWNAPSKLTFALGKDVAGFLKYADLAKMPHLLVAGATNSGKSVCLNTLIASILYRATPADVKFLMIDPKRVELSLWDGIPHLLHPVVKDVKQAAGILRSAIKEMERRYDLFSRMQTRNIDGYNQRVPEDERIPYVVLVVDELADLMMQAAAEVETSICRLAQLARATGIHLVIATQRPSVDVITGTIKANISSRISFAVSSQVDSRTILDMSGAERLIGRGDMLFMPIDASKPMRVQGCFLSEPETNDLVQYLKSQGSPSYTMTPLYSNGSGGDYEDDGGDEDVDDDLYERAVRLVVTNGQCSTSMLQRRFKIGYTRAARIVDVMADRGIVGPPDGAKPRELLVSRDDVDRMFRTGRYGIPDDIDE